MPALFDDTPVPPRADISDDPGIAQQMKAALAVAPVGTAVVFDRGDFKLVDQVDIAFGELPWPLDTQNDGLGLGLLDLVDATYHESLHATFRRATAIGVGRTSAQLAGGAVNQLTLVCFGPRSADQAIAVFDSEGFSTGLIVDEDDARTRLICNRDGTIVSTDASVAGYAELDTASNQWASQLIHEADRPAYITAITSVLNGEPYARLLAQGSIEGLAFEIMIAAQRSTIVIDFFDRSLRNQTVTALQRSQTQFNLLSETLPVGVFVVGTGGRMTFTSDRLRDMLDPIVAAEWDWVNVVHPEDRHLFENAVTELPSSRQFSIELRCYRRDGSVGWFRIAGSDMRGPDGLLTRVVGFVEDVDERRELQQKIAYQASFDSLTALPNRITIVSELRERLSRRDDYGLTAVLFVDLDGFKLINDSQGHSVGDSVLLEVAQRFRRAIGARDVVGRFGGDEFVVVASEIDDERQALAIARQLHDVLATPVLAEGRIITVNTSIGIALAEADGATSEELIGNADIAMYEAKAAGRDRTVIFDATLRSRASQRFNMTADLRHARRRRELRLEYQPIIELDSGTIVGAEALVRWEHPTMGRIGPGVFIPLAEEIGLISDVGEWVVEQACADLHRLRTVDAVDESFVMSINASTHQFNDVASLATSSLASLQQFGLRPSQLRFELTESVPLTQIPAAASRIKQLTSYGFGLAIDDFGTGYSSLGYLTMLPFDVLKLDLSLIAQVQAQSPALAVVRSLTTMSEDIGFTIVAEGIETAAQLNLLNATGVRLGQGFHISRPIALDQLAELGSGGQSCFG